MVGAMGLRFVLLVPSIAIALAGCASAKLELEPLTVGKIPPEKIAEMRALEVESAARLALEGDILFHSDLDKRDGYQYCGMASTLLEQGELRRGIREAAKAFYLGRRNKDEFLLAFATRDLAYAYSLAGYLDKADQFAKESLEHVAKSRPATDRSGVLGPSHRIRGEVLLRRGRPAEAIVEFDKALEGASEGFKPFVKASLANAYLAQRNYAKARELFKEAEASARPKYQPLIRRGFAEVALAEGRLQDSARLFTEVAAQATGPDQEYHRFWALEGAARSYRIAGDRARAVEGYRQAIAAAEAVRARFRSEEFKAGFFGDMQRVFDDAVAVLADARQVDAALEVSERSRGRALLDMVRGRVVASSGAEAFADPLGRPMTAAQLRAAVPPGVALVEYHVLADRAYAWVVRRSGLRLITLEGGREQLVKAAGEFRAAVARKAPEAIALGGALHQRLVRPLALAANEPVVFVPHDALHYVPFHALHGPGGYLVEERPISVAPSASVYARLATRERGTAAHVLALGNPDLGSARLALPAAEREVEEIRTLYAGAEVYVRADATKERMLTRAPQSQVVHVAAHAEVDEIDPLYSVIHLAHAGKGSGNLEAHEVYRLDLGGATLVALSACETGLGKISRGDEMWGFTRSFLSAGAPALLVSLWEVDDASTAKIMRTFYGEMKGGAATRAALRTAQLEVLRDTRTAHPFFWAPFILVGDGR